MPAFSRLRFRAYARDLELAIWDLHMGLKLQGLASKMAKLEHDLEYEAEKISDQIDATADHGTKTFEQSRAKLVDYRTTLDGMTGSIDALAASNGGPKLEPTAEKLPPVTLQEAVPKSNGAAPGPYPTYP